MGSGIILTFTPPPDAVLYDSRRTRASSNAIFCSSAATENRETVHE
jgi:hypothetical protein